MTDDNVVDLRDHPFNAQPEKSNTELVDELTDAIVIGWNESGEFFFSSTADDPADINYLLDLAKNKILDRS